MKTFVDGAEIGEFATETIALELLGRSGIDHSRITFQRSPDERREAVRARIDQGMDLRSREGILADALAIAIVGLANLATGLAKATNLAQVREATAPLIDIGESVLAAVEDGSLQLPYNTKPGGALGVLQDLRRLNASVSEALERYPHPAPAPVPQPSEA